MVAKKYLSDFPDLVAEYAPRQDFSPSELTFSSNRRVKWVCALDHTWETTVAQRTRVKTGCPFCSNQRVWPGYNDLLTRFPDIAAEWHPSRNGDLVPSEVISGSKRKVWWICSKRHEYDTKVISRTSKGTGCRICSGNEVLKGFNDLESKFPTIAREWHSTLNGNLLPSSVNFGSPAKRWWSCPDFDHAYETSPSKRTGPSKAGCPYCSNQMLLPGFNDLATVKPELAAQWDYDKNHPLTPSDVAPTINQPLWWKCPNGAHPSWLSKSRKSADCPVCLNQTLLTGFNDLSSQNPELAAQWHPTLNGERKPELTLTGGRQKIWWLCAEGHHWEAGIYTRARSGCPFCGFKRLWPGFNDLATVSPDMAAEWHPSKNGDLTPKDIMSSVPKVVWWLCPAGHSYQASPNGRSRVGPKGRRGCNICANKVVLKDVNHLSATHPQLWEELVKAEINPERLDKLHSGSKDKVPWRCTEGHKWRAVVYSRAAGNGCPDCADYGFKPDKPAVVYFLRHRELKARKIGITNTHTKYDRVAAFESKGWEVLGAWPMVGKLARSVEAQAFAWIRGDLLLPQFLTAEDMGRNGGETETFSGEGPSDSEITEYLDRCVRGVFAPKSIDTP